MKRLWKSTAAGVRHSCGVALAAMAAVMTLAMACCPCRRIAVSGRDSVRVETSVHTERIRDTVFVSLPAERERRTAADSASRLETSLAESEARINPDGTLFHSLANKPGSLPVPTEREIVYRDSVVFRDRIRTETVEVDSPPSRWQAFRLNAFWPLLAALLLAAALSHRKR